ncbi:MAG TPA: hypothetical protein VKZ53_10090 [Candidatus Angelobacter sp.]|nr:hypothetical protein [Candidatus Angelobacter sp.]
MSQLTAIPEIQGVQAVGQWNRRATMIAVALVSFASLLLELAMTRLYSVVLFYHFAFFAISVALLGLGAGGVFAHVRSLWLAKFEIGTLGARLSLLNSFVILAATEVVLHIPVALEVNGRNFGRLTIIYLVTAVPFFCTGLLFSVLFARSSHQISSLYGADLLGGALACLAVVPLLNILGAPNALLFSCLVMAIGAALWSSIDAPSTENTAHLKVEQSRIRMAAIITAAGFAVLMAANHSGRLVDVVYAKGIFRDSKWVEFAQWNAISRIEVNNQNGARYVVIDADATSAIMNADPGHWDQEQNQNPTPVFTGLPEHSSFNWKKSLMSAAPAVANVLRPHGEFAIIGPGGGVDVLRAAANGSPNVTGIEINPIIIQNVMRGKYADYSYHLYNRPEVHIHIQDGRSFIRNAPQSYDVVQMTLVDTWASTAAGAFALSENNLYTVEAFREYLAHLKPDGMIAITRWEFKQPREALRVVSQAMQALHQSGVADPRNNFVLIADGGLDEDGRPVLALAKKSPFTSAEYAAVAEHVSKNPNLVWLNPTPEYAGRQELPAAAFVFQRLIQSNEPERFALDYPYNVAPVSDNAPFFFFTLKTRHVISNILAGTGHGMDWRINLGVVVLGMVLIVSIIAVLVFLILPLFFHRGDSRHGNVASLLYFVAVGVGYILVEISLIQRFVLFLGHPTYALTVVVFLLLLSSGFGSMMAKQWIRDSRRMRLFLCALIALIVLNVVLLPSLLPTAVGLSFIAKLIVSVAILFPLGFLMGLPFPSGLKLLADSGDSTLEWAWAMNAAASVLGSVAAMVIALHYGLSVALGCAAGAYMLAALCSRGWRHTLGQQLRAS